LNAAFEGTLPKMTEDAELRRCFGKTILLLVAEAHQVDPLGAQQLVDLLAELVRTADVAAAGSRDEYPH
jgi:hypothetical protein